MALSNADCLGLPILGAETSHHEAEGNERCAYQNEGPEVTSIIERSSDDAIDEEQGRLNATNPRDVE